MARLTRVSGAAPAEPFALRDKLTIGRSPDNDVVVSDAAVSRRHARIVKRDGRYRLVDLSSENGTWVEGRRVRECWLRDGDRIGVGEALLEFQLDAGESLAAGTPHALSAAVAVAVAVGAIVLTVAVSGLVWRYWPRSARGAAASREAAGDCYDVCFRRCRVLGDRSAGPWCNDPACCQRACGPFKGIGDEELDYRVCEQRREEDTTLP